VGRWKCHLLEGGRQHLDGGAMFGVVPKPLWEKKNRPDERNRIPLGLRCMLVEHDAGPVLIDTGVGNKESEKFKGIYGVENTGTHGPTQLEDALLEAAFKPSDIRYVINTHLHFDHAGGNTFLEASEPPSRRTAGPPISLSFPNATYVVQEGELEYATHTNERTAASYFLPNWEPVESAGRLKLVRGEVELIPGITLLPTPGHVPHHQSVLVRDGAEVACFLADVMPTTAHVPLPWIMGYDVEPLVTLESKRRLEARAHAEEWRLVFEHEPDPAQSVGRLQQDGKSFIYQRLDTP
jgi:glyoxylase-like metal-dependent hydrolase (beta-lactamase superfamily II)